MEQSSGASSRDVSDGEGEPSLEMVIQYGRGQCPQLFLPLSFVDASQIRRNEDDVDDSSGSIMLSIPVSADEIATQQTLDDVPATDKDTLNKNNPNKQILHRVRVRWYRFQPSLSNEMEQADIILCHAGAGTLLEALSIPSSYTNQSTTKTTQQKIINAVINSKLMDNHQSELAEELEKRNHIHVTRDCTVEWTTMDGASKFWTDIEQYSPVPFTGGRSRVGVVDLQQGHMEGNQVSGFQMIVDRVMGFYPHQGTKGDNTKKTR